MNINGLTLISTLLSLSFTVSANSEYSQTTKSSDEQLNIKFTLGKHMNNWWARQRVYSSSSNDDSAAAKTNYKMNNSILTEYAGLARWGEHALSVSIFHNDSELELDDNSEEPLWRDGIDMYAVQYESGDFSSDSKILRLRYSNMDAGGIAQYQTSTIKESQSFETQRQQFNFSVLSKSGRYLSLEYLDFDSPSTIGLVSNTGRFLGTVFDPNIKLETYSILAGFDSSYYASRFEPNYNQFYFAGNIGFGVTHIDFNQQRVRSITNDRIRSIGGDLAFNLDAMVELGYMYQHKTDMLFGLGGTFKIGWQMHLSALSTGSHWDDYNNTEQALRSSEPELALLTLMVDGLIDASDASHYITYSRQDAVSGLFANFSLVF